MSQKWFVKTRSGSAGPFSLSKLKEFLEQNRIKPNTAISLDGEKWVMVKTVKELVPDTNASSESIVLADESDNAKVIHLDADDSGTIDLDAEFKDDPDATRLDPEMGRIDPPEAKKPIDPNRTTKYRQSK